MATKGSVVTLVQPRVSEDTVRACEYLLQEARAGRAVGLMWGLIRPGYLYEVDAAGEANRSPAFSQGVVLTLLKEIGKLPIQEK